MHITVLAHMHTPEYAIQRIMRSRSSKKALPAQMMYWWYGIESCFLEEMLTFSF